MSLTNHTWHISHHIMSMVINGIGVDTQTQTHAHTHIYRCVNKNNFKKPGARGRRLRVPGLKINV